MDTTKNCRLQSWTLYKSADCRWISITILCVSFTNSATVGRLEQVQLCNRLIDQSAYNIIGLKCVKECLILKYKYNPESLNVPTTRLWLPIYINWNFSGVRQPDYSHESDCNVFVVWLYRKSRDCLTFLGECMSNYWLTTII